jgi:hypothetical protein
MCLVAAPASCLLPPVAAVSYAAFSEYLSCLSAVMQQEHANMDELIHRCVLTGMLHAKAVVVVVAVVVVCVDARRE